MLKDKERKGRGKQSSGRTLSFYIGDRIGLVWPYVFKIIHGRGGVAERVTLEVFDHGPFSVWKS